MGPPSSRAWAALTAVAAVAALALVLALRSHDPGGPARARTCVYAAHSIAGLDRFATLVGAPVDCAVVFNDAATDWHAWEHPWFLDAPNPDHAWGRWATTRGAGRSLVITQSLFPATLNDTDWLTPGAAGAFTGHARTLARNLVAAGLGHATIRLGHEANGTWFHDAVGTSAGELRRWAHFWRATVLAMRAVPGAEHLRFDWCTTPAGRPIPLADYYPGDDVVDIVGIDAYDSLQHPRSARWTTIAALPGGLDDVARFARLHHKPLSLPEWGIGPAGSAGAAGDDPGYVRGIARVLRTQDVAYEAYFFARQWGDELVRSPRSLAVLRSLMALQREGR